MTHLQPRIDALRQIMDRRGADALMIVPGWNMVYFTGLEFHLSERPIIAIFTREGLGVVVPKLEQPKLDQRPDLAAQPFAWDDSQGFMGAFERAIDALNLRGKTIGVDGMTMRLSEWLALSSIDSSMKPLKVEDDLTRIRARKQPDEIAQMRRAVEISERALTKLLSEVQPGMTEMQIGARLNQLQMELGAHGLAFDSLVQTGPNSASPHGFTTDRVLQRDEILLIDYGCKVDGYPSDITRTFVIGTPSDEMQRIYDVVLRANEAARAVGKPGVPMGELDRAARDVIEAAGYGEYFPHRTGHGLGLDPHETLPQIAPNFPDVLEVGMTFTIEPGIYIAGLGGVRIEDNMVVTETGLESLTTYPRSLAI